MSDGEFKKDDELEKLSLDSEKEDSSSLDEYGVWIKGSSDTAGKTDGLSDGADESLELSSESLSTEEGEVQAFDFDGLSDEVSVSEDDSSIENIQSNSQDSDSKDSSFDDIDMSDFFTDLDCDENMESDEKEDEESISMDLNFDTVDSYAEQDNKDDFDAMLDDLNVENASSDNNNALSSDTSEEDEINDLLSDLNSSPSTVIESNDDQVSPDIELNINVDEVQDFAKLADDGEDASISISFPSTDHCEQIEKTKENDSEIVVKNTVVDPENG